MFLVILGYYEVLNTLAYKIIVIDHFPISESGKIMYAKLLE